jgi:RHS repeat-associated protein
MTCYNNNFTTCATPPSVPILPITKRDVYYNYNSTDPNGVGASVENTYDSYGNVLTELTNLLGANYRTTTYTYGSWNGSGCVAIGNYIYDKPCTIVVTDDMSNTIKAQTRITYNSKGHPTSVSRWTGSAWLTSTAGYNSNGTLAWSKDPAGHQTSFAYNGSGGCNNLLPTSTTYAKSSVGSDSTVWNCDGGVVSSTTDVNGNPTSYTYNDPLWRLTNTARPDGGSTSISYTDTVPQNISTTTTLSSSQSFVHTVALDGLGRAVATYDTDPNTSADQRVSQTVYNNLGQVVGIYNPYFTTSDQTYGETQYSYDAIGRNTSITTPIGNSTNISYNGFAYQVQQYPSFENITKIYQTDSLGRVINVCEATNQTQADNSVPTACNLGINPTTKGFLATTSYDVLGNLTGFSYGATAQNRVFSYDGLSRMTSETYPESGTTTYTYDASPYQGNLTSKTFPAPNQTGSATVTATYSWDAMNRFLCLSYSDGTTPGVCDTYDQSSSPSGWPNNLGGGSISLSNSKGRLSWSSATNFTGVDAIFGYDTMGSVNTYAQCTPAGCNNGTRWVVQYQYNYIGEPAGGMSIGGGTQWTNTYNSIGQLTQVWSNCLTNNSSGCTSSGDVVSGIAYNALGKPTSDLLGNGFQESWNYDHNGRIISYNPGGTSPYGYWLTWNPGTIAASGDAVNGNYNYSYDSFGRIACMYNGSACTSSGSTEAIGWAYDRWGNRWKQNVVAGSGPAPQYSFAQNNQFAGGNGVGYDAAGNVISYNDGATAHTFKYDAANRLIAVDGGTTATYTYNSRGLRVQRFVGSNQSEKLFDLSGFATADMVPGSTAMYFGEIYSGGRHWATSSWYGSSGTTMYLLTDWLGGIRMWKDQSGNTDRTCENFPFGDAKTCQGGFGTAWGVFGDENDSEDNTYHTPYRQQSPTQGRWLTPDPAGMSVMDVTNPQTWNRYAYALNNPLSYTDPTGLYCEYFGESDESDDGASFDFHSSSGECGGNGGTWFDDPSTTVTVNGITGDVDTLSTFTGNDGLTPDVTVQRSFDRSFPCKQTAGGTMKNLENNFPASANWQWGPLHVTFLQSGPLTPGSMIPIDGPVGAWASMEGSSVGFLHAATSAVTVASVSSNSFTFATVPGMHPFDNGTVTFSASGAANGNINFGVDVNGAFADPFSKFAFNYGMKAVEASIWHNLMNNVQAGCR